MARFHSGDIDFLGNVDIVSEGFDAPACDTVIFDLPTQSLTRYLQAAGRTRRPAPGKRALLIDATGCSRWLGLPDAPRTWTLEDGHVRAPMEAGRPRAERGPSGPDLQFEEVATDLVQAGGAGDYVAPLAAPKKRSSAPTPKATRRDLGMAIRDAKQTDDPIKALEALAQQLGYRPGWVGHMARIHGMTEG